jgi:hypothetical protein
LIQPKLTSGEPLTIGQPNDRYEQEADRVADMVMRMPEPHLQRQTVPEEEEGEEETLRPSPLAGQITPLVQRQVEPEEQEEEESVAGPKDREEEETIQLKPLAGQITPLMQRQVDEPDEEEEEEPIRAKMTDGARVQRQEEQPEEEEEEEEREPIQAKQAQGPTPHIGPRLAARIRSLKGNGQPLSQAERHYFEPRFGYDFSQVRVHASTQAVETARAVNAQAYTVGGDVFFGSGQYAPETSVGKRLLAHELTHVLQQGARAKRSPGTAPPVPSSVSGVQTDLAQRRVKRSRPIILDDKHFEVLGRTAGFKITYLRDRSAGESFGEFAAKYYGNRRLWRKLYLYNRARNPEFRKPPPYTSKTAIPSLEVVYLPSIETLKRRKMIDVPVVKLSFHQNEPDVRERRFFKGLADSKARAIRAIRVDYPSSCTFETKATYGSIPYDTGDDIIKTIKMAAQCTGNPVKEVHIFGHSGAFGVWGTTTGKQFGLYDLDPGQRARRGGGRSVKDIPKETLADNVVFVLHGCLTAYSDDSFAEALLKELLGKKPRAKVYGHYVRQPAGGYYYWKEFSKRYPEGRWRRTIPYHRPYRRRKR